MHPKLQAAFERASHLDPDEQARLGEWLLQELESEAAWQAHFEASQDVLSALADEALDDYLNGRI